MTFDILFYDMETGEKAKKTVNAVNHTVALTLLAKEMGVDRYKLREFVFDIRRVVKNA